MLTLTDVRFGFPTRPDFLGPISLSVEPGQCWAIVGPNGAGKSTLLRLMAGLLRPHRGTIMHNGEPLPSHSARRRARCIAYVPQRLPSDLDLSAREVVLMGRYPYRSLGMFESVEDHRVVEQAMTLTETLAFADRLLPTLSGGETQRVHVAAALAQQPRILLLDEPTASLDLQHQLAIFAILSDRTRHDGLTTVIVSHDVNLAARFCSHVLLLNDGKSVALGPPERVLAPSVLEPVYSVKLMALSVPGCPDRRWLVPRDAPSEPGP